MGHHHHHGHGCDHDHGHGHHHHAPASYDTAFAAGVVLNLSFVCIEAFYGFMAKSMALLADAGHNLGDVLSLLLAWGASWLARRPPSMARTYGFGRSSILASLVNAVTLLVAVGGIAWGAVDRLLNPVEVVSKTVMFVAMAGFVINGATAMMFMRGRKEDINIRGAFLHMAYDAVISLGVVAAAIVITATGLMWIDPVVSIVIAGIIGLGSFGLLRDSLDLTLDAVPRGVDPAEVRKFLAATPGVTAVHDLHIWSISTTSVALTAHLVRPEGHGGDAWLFDIGQQLQKKFKIDHATIQVERGDTTAACALAPDEVV